MEKFAKALYMELVEARNLDLTEEDLLAALREADQRTSPSPFASLEAAHSLLDQVGVPKLFSDGTEAPLDARLVAFIRHVQGRLAAAGGGCSGCAR
ncbi:MAG: hypothetical protein ACUVSF_06110 [Anaerolineae bacterium]